MSAAICGENGNATIFIECDIRNVAVVDSVPLAGARAKL
jgi:hypothetical protein